MKKTYYIPQTSVVTLNAQHMMAASTPNVGVGEGSVDAGGVETRRHHGIGTGLWEDMK